ncbi:MAG TPA: PAS domain S-box protein [Fimbriiglobus sp.]|nr:PAS domain S-box protein [Fimbriiglobus sp.]
MTVWLGGTFTAGLLLGGWLLCRTGRPDWGRLDLMESAVVHARDAVIVLEAEPTGGPGRSVLYVNEAFTRMTGYTAAEVVGRSLHFLRGPKSCPVTLARIKDALNSDSPLQVDLLNYRKDGSEVWVELSLVPVRDGAGRCRHWVMIQRDASDRKRAEEALTHSEELLRGMFETAAAGVSVTDARGVFVSANPAFAAMLGRSVAEIVGRSPKEFTHPDDWALHQPMWREVLAGGRDGFQLRKRYVRPDGGIVWTEMSVAVVRGPAGEFVRGIGVSVDMTDRRRLEEQLRHVQKMEAIGQMAGGIAHDFNNLLTGVIGNLALVALPPGDANADLIGAAERAANRAAELTRKLLGYARKNQLVVAPVRVGDFVREVVDILGRTFDPRIRIVTDLATPDLVLADAALVNQAILNLCLNARDAMPDGGTLTIRAATAQLSEEEAANRADARPGTFVRLTVSDTGNGMTPEVRARIFEPFYTTKPVGQGTGLGLPMVHGIVQQHSGWVECETAPGRGTRFDLYLPRSTAATVPVPRPVDRRVAAPAPDVTTPPPAGSRTVLLVDDEDMIRCLGRSVLEQAGYRVLEAHDGADAVDLFRRECKHIDLVILDLTMPRLSGRDAFRSMTAIAPDARVLFSSGYSSDDLSDVTGAVGLLAKPYRPQDLVSAVRRALDARLELPSPSATQQTPRPRAGCPTPPPMDPIRPSQFAG